MKEGIIIIAGSISVFFAILFWKDVRGIFQGDSKKGKKEAKIKVKDNETKAVSTQNSSVKVIKRWEMPGVLTEISGISYIDDQRFACVQDESGIVFIYNVNDNKIEKEITFSGAGDYEGVAIAGETIYVIRADGQLFEISGSNTGKPSVKEYSTGLTVKNNIESLCFDKTNNRLLLTGKEPDNGSAEQKLIYGFDLAGKKMFGQPVITVDISNQEFSGKSSKKGNQFHPSEMGIHPVTNDIYIIDGPAAKLVITDPSGKIKHNLQLDNASFPQAEGISFSPAGGIYISSEGKKAKATGSITQVEVAVQ